MWFNKKGKMKQLMLLEVRGRTKPWDFIVEGDSDYLEEWREDGLDINPLVNVIPEWVVDIGLLRPWCFFQDLLNSKWAGRILIGCIIVGIIISVV